MEAAGAAATDLGAVGFGWRAQRGGFAGRMCGWGARSLTAPSILGLGVRHAGFPAACTPQRSRCDGHRTLVPAP